MVPKSSWPPKSPLALKRIVPNSEEICPQLVSQHLQSTYYVEDMGLGGPETRMPHHCLWLLTSWELHQARWARVRAGLERIL